MLFYMDIKKPVGFSPVGLFFVGLFPSFQSITEGLACYTYEM